MNHHFPHSINMATNSLPTLSLDAAKIAANAAEEKAKQLGIGTSITASKSFFCKQIQIYALHPTYSKLDSTDHLSCIAKT